MEPRYLYNTSSHHNNDYGYYAQVLLTCKSNNNISRYDYSKFRKLVYFNYFIIILFCPKDTSSTSTYIERDKKKKLSIDY